MSACLKIMATSNSNHWFFTLLEKMAASHGARALANTQMMVRGVPQWSHPTVVSVATSDAIAADDQPARVANALGLKSVLVAQHWDAISQHKWTMSEKLGRDVGANVAALDYFENFRRGQLRMQPNFVARTWNSLLRNLDNDGPKSIAAFERAMSGSRSLAN